MIKKSELQTRINKRGYQEFKDPRTGKWTLNHRRAALNKFGRLRPGFEVHHIDGDKLNNRHENLVEIHRKVHARLHHKPEICLRCGRQGHWSNKCRFKTFWDRTRLVE